MDGYSIEPVWTVEDLAERLAELEYSERRQAVELADKIAATHYE
ncbi:hypothetical protein [Streptomyces sp. H34-S4]|nr:hypothetical protein [Streptomyces sp. H34-S4]MCY0933651.1 hypothetical protein [Streptomyces sp. H34-S4]